MMAELLVFVLQVLGSLKQKIDAALREEDTRKEALVKDAQAYLLEREDRLINVRKHALEAPASLPATSHTADPFDRGKHMSLRVWCRARIVYC